MNGFITSECRGKVMMILFTECNTVMIPRLRKKFKRIVGNGWKRNLAKQVVLVTRFPMILCTELGKNSMSIQLSVLRLVTSFQKILLTAFSLSVTSENKLLDRIVSVESPLSLLQKPDGQSEKTRCRNKKLRWGHRHRSLRWLSMRVSSHVFQ